MVGNSNSPSSTRRRSVSKLRAVAIAPMAAEALGIIAISSAVAPIDVPNRRAQPLDLADPALPRRAARLPRLGERVEAALTSTDNAPWEQLFT